MWGCRYRSRSQHGMREWDRSKHRPTLTFGSYVNFLLEYIVEIRYQGIDIGDNNDPATENVPKETGTTASKKKALNWKGECIICTRKSTNMLNYSATFTNSARDDILKMSRLDSFLILLTSDLYESNNHSWEKKCFGESNVYLRIHRLGWLLALHGLLGWNPKLPILVVHHGSLYGRRCSILTTPHRFFQEVIWCPKWYLIHRWRGAIWGWLYIYTTIGGSLEPKYVWPIFLSWINILD